MKFIVGVFFILLFVNVFAQKSFDSEPAKVVAETKFEFDKTFVELGNVKKGDTRSFSYEMSNTGKTDIEISYLDFCACTEVDYPTGKVLKPGESMVFDVVFDSATKDEEETIEIAMELKNIDPKTELPYYLTLDYHFIIVK